MTRQATGTEDLDPRSAGLDTMSTLDIVTLMNEEDATVPRAIRPALPAIALAVDDIAARLRHGGRLIYVGAGTSGRIAELDAIECVPTFSIPPGMVMTLMAGGQEALAGSDEAAEDDVGAARVAVAALGVGPGDVLIGIAASGSTPFVLAALREARERGTLTVAVSCNEPAPMLDVAHHGIAALTGPEVLAGSTRLKAGTAQKLILNMISTAVMVRLGRVYGNRMVDVAVGNRKLRARAEGIVADLVGCAPDAAAELLAAAEDEVRTAVVMGLAGVDASEARARLAAAGGDLRQIVADGIAAEHGRRRARLPG